MRTASLSAPILTYIAFPCTIVSYRYSKSGQRLFPSEGLAAIGLIIVAAGTFFAAIFLRLLSTRNAAATSWDPSKKPEAASPNRYIRNPMLMSLMLVLFGEAVAFGSTSIGMILILGFLANIACFILSGKPGSKRSRDGGYLE